MGTAQKRKEETMKKMKRLLAMLLAAVMVMGMSVTALAASTDSLDTALRDDAKVATVKGYPSEEDAATVTISGLIGTPDVKLYQIASPVYGERGLKEFQFVTGAERLSGNQGPTADLITEVANKILLPTDASGRIEATDKTPTWTKTGADGKYTYTASMKAGAYIAIIKSTGDTEEYNPIYLTVTYNEAGQVVAGNVSVNEKYLWGTTAVAKHTSPDVEKEIDTTTTTRDSLIKADGTSVSAEGGETASLGDRISYTVKPKPMPNYPKNAANQTLFIADTMNTGLTFDYTSLKVKLQDSEGNFLKTRDAENNEIDLALSVGTNGEITLPASSFTGQDAARVIGTAAPTKNGTVQATATDATGFNINFNYASLIYDAVGNVFIPVVTYDAILNESAQVGKPGLDNKVKLYFASNSSSGSTHTGTEEPTEGEDIKKKEDTEIVYTYRLAVRKVDDTAAPNAKPLGGAVFGVYKEETCENLVCTMISNTDGYAVSNQIAASTESGTYWVKELQAPTGYQLDSTAREVKVNWETATSTATVTTQTVTWTTEVKEAEVPGNPKQIGWVLDGELKALDAYTEEQAEEAGAVKAYQKFGTASTSTVTGTVTNENNKGEGIVSYGDIVNTKLVALPSTGGIGTTIFTIGGCAIMIVAAGLFFATRRKAEK